MLISRLSIAILKYNNVVQHTFPAPQILTFVISGINQFREDNLVGGFPVWYRRQSVRRRFVNLPAERIKTL
jgi:hypothetical protein